MTCDSLNMENSHSNSNYQFAHPVFILAAPRSGSTLLFETLMQSAELWTIGDESHDVFETIPELRPGQGVTSNRLTSREATRAVVTNLHRNFLVLLRNRAGLPYLPQAKKIGPVRMLEKTPKNALRVPFLNAGFPDSLFIYLYRDPRENISSIMEAWRSGRFVTYRDLLGKNRHWSLLLPPEWPSVNGHSLESIAAYQWKMANKYILDDLGKLAPERWTATSYQALLSQPEAEFQRLFDFIGIPMDEHVLRLIRGELPLSRFTLTPPEKGKWRKNGQALARVLPGLQRFIRSTERVVSIKSGQRVHTMSIECAETGNSFEAAETVHGKVGRNAPCPCGSGKKYKQCHGSIV